jgi:alpha-L-rhamnosidase
MFKQAKWLWKSTERSINSYGWFFKRFEIENDVLEAVLTISAHNHFKLIVNGVTISGLVSPAPSVSSKEKLYLTYDLKHHLVQGSNLIEIVVLYLGGSGQNYCNDQPGFICEGHVLTTKKSFVIKSDETFRYYLNIPYKDEMPFQQSRRITPVQLFDSSLILDEKCSKSSVVLEGYPSYRPQEIPEGAVHEEINPTLCCYTQEVKVFDVGEIISGYVRINVYPEIDEAIVVRYGEDLANDRVKHSVANEYSDQYKDVFIVKKDHEVELKADFTYKAFRYFEVISKSRNITVTAIKAGTKITLNGALKSKTNKEINDLFDLFEKTQKNNILGLLVDCPHREQAQYLGDSALQAESIIYNVVERKQLLDKVIRDFTLAQHRDGSFPFVAPGSTNHVDFSLKIPEYDLYYIELVYKRYQIDKDQSIVDLYEPSMSRLLNHYIDRIDETGLVKKSNNWHISDWPYPTVNQEGNYLTFENLLLYDAFRMFLSLPVKNSEFERYHDDVRKLRHSIKTHLKQNNRFIDSMGSCDSHQGINAYALTLGLFDDYEVESVLENIIKQGLNSSIILSRKVLETLLIHNKVDEALAYVFDFEKGWGNVIRSGSKTMWEGFDDIESHSHAWGMYPIRLFQAYIIGIKLDSNQNDMVHINPKPTKRVKNLAASVVTEKGLVYFEYTIKNAGIQFDYDVPVGINVIFNYLGMSKELNGQGSFEISYLSTN